MNLRIKKLINMPKEEFLIEITASGEVKVSFKDIAGSHVVEYVELLTRLIGKLQEDEIHLPDKRAQPKPKVSIVSSNNKHIQQKSSR